MRLIIRYFFIPFSLICVFLICASHMYLAPAPAFPYKKAGLTERQAAAHLLSRFTYGARPGDIDAVVKMGLERWFNQQLKGGLADDSLNLILKDYDAINLSNSEVVRLFPNNGQVLRMAIKDGVIHKDSVKQDKKEYRGTIQDYMKKSGFKPQAELFRQLINQKIVRAAYSNNQMEELLTDFWFNHFNVSITKGSCAEFIPAYERDVIRANVLGSFGNLVLETAKSPAMLMYLDNFSSSGTPENTVGQLNRPVRKTIRSENARMMIDSTSKKQQAIKKLQQNRKNQGLNENYAREVLELHTLGVDGGYTQSDVTQAARILTGWTVYPMENGYGSAIRNVIDRVGVENLEKRGFVRDGDFLFAATRHDNEEKTVLGRNFPAGGGYQEGVELLKMLAEHPSTAKFISRKLAVRFVNDNPPQSLVDRMSAEFTKTKGGISDVISVMVYSPEFWSKSALREKTKSPFELAISAVRALDADVNAPFQLNTWINKMGQKMYYYQAPTGFPDKGQYWINSGSLLNRMNFGLALASQRIPGTKVDLHRLNKNREPESAEAALMTYSTMLLPERELSQTISRLSPMLNDPQLHEKIEDAALQRLPKSKPAEMAGNDPLEAEVQSSKEMNEKSVREKAAVKVAPPGTMLAQVVGVILGSPEFQRR